jgi:chemotaxis protein histidine kinase CheA
MRKTSFDPNLSPRAYRLYVEQLEQGVAKATTILFAHEEIDSETARNFATLFHKMRGGAGFFGLDSVAEIAGKLETLFFNNEVDELTRQRDSEPLIQRLSSLAEQIPRPAEQ